MTSEPIWNQFLTERDKAVFATSGYGARAGFGTRPAVVVIDVTTTSTSPATATSRSSSRSSAGRNSCGEDGWAAIPPLQKLIQGGARQAHPGVLFDQHAPGRQLGRRQLGLERTTAMPRRRPRASPTATATRSSTRSRPGAGRTS
ncbi:MAG: hypothetical protein WDO24_25050 [Pseudomonadota bacterium]